jgi:hypothetical protein
MTRPQINNCHMHLHMHIHIPCAPVYRYLTRLVCGVVLGSSCIQSLALPLVRRLSVPDAAHEPGPRPGGVEPPGMSLGGVQRRHA